MAGATHALRPVRCPRTACAHYLPRYPDRLPTQLSNPLLCGDRCTGIHQNTRVDNGWERPLSPVVERLLDQRLQHTPSVRYGTQPATSVDASCLEARHFSYVPTRPQGAYVEHGFNFKAVAVQSQVCNVV